MQTPSTLSSTNGTLLNVCFYLKTLSNMYYLVINIELSANNTMTCAQVQHLLYVLSV